MTPWPDGFQYTEKHKAIADGLGLNVAREFADFHDRSIAKNYTYADWDAAFRVWLRKAPEFKQARAK
jgi:hypothetical protein